MTVREFSDEFDSMIKVQGLQYELDEYEKSLLLTEAQESIVIGLYNGTLKSEGFEETEELRRYLDDLITEIPLDPVDYPVNNTYRFTLPDNLMFIVYETAILTSGVHCEGDVEMSVYPARHDEWSKIKNNPFRGPNDRRAIRLDLGNNQIEVICKHPVSQYYIRYLHRPRPIILVNLPDGLTIEEKYTGPIECELNPALHRMILRTAVQLCQAKYARQTS